MKWQILILTQPSRREFLRQLTELLEPQIKSLGLRRCESVEVITTEFDPKYDLGTNRQKLKEQSDAEYISFIDDDDLVAPDYIASILPLLDGVDQVGFNFACHIDHAPALIAEHSLKHTGWYVEPGTPSKPVKLCRDISHMTPMRRELSLAKPMSGGFGEDRRWADAMRGLVKTEHYVDKVLYYYLSRTRKNDAKDANDPWRIEFLEKLQAKV